MDAGGVGKGLPGGGAHAAFPDREGGGDPGSAGRVGGARLNSKQGMRIMGDTKKAGRDALPGNHGQFGANVETEEYEALPDMEASGAEESRPGDVEAPGEAEEPSVLPETEGPGDAAKTPGQHQEQGGMRS